MRQPYYPNMYGNPHSQGGTYDNSMFNELRPAYVGAPVEEFTALRQELTQAAKDNLTAQGILDDAFSTSIVNMGQDETGKELINQHKQAFEQSLSQMINEKNIAYAGSIIQKHANDFARDPRIKGRQKVVDEFNATMQAVADNKEVSVATRKAFRDSYSYDDFADIDDERNMYELKEMPLPYERIDVMKTLIEYANSSLPYPDIKEINGMRFRKADGTFTSEPEEADDETALVTIVTNGVEKELKPEEVQKLIDGAIENNDALRGYLIQERLVSDYYNNGTNPVARFSEIYNNEELLRDVKANVSNSLLDLLTYKQRISDTDIKSISLYKPTEGAGADKTYNPYEQVRAYDSALKNQTKNTDVEEVTNTLRSQISAIVDELLRYRIPGTTRQEVEDDFNDLIEAVNNADMEAFERFAAKYPLDNALMSAQIDKAFDIGLSLRLTQDKLDKASNDALYRTRVDETGTTVTELKHPEITEIIESPITQALLEEGRINQNTNELAFLHDIKKELETETHQARNTRFWDFLRQSAEARQGLTAVNEDPDVVAARELTSFSGKLDRVLKKLDKEVNRKLEPKRKASDATTSNSLLAYDIKSHSTAFNEIQKILTIEQLKKIKLYDSDGNDISADVTNRANNKHPLYGANSFKLKSIQITPHSFNESPNAWVIDGELTKYDDKSSAIPKSVRFYSPMGAGYGGFDQGELFDALVASDPMWQAYTTIEKILKNNTPGDNRIPFAPNLSMNINTDTGDVTYSEYYNTHNYNEPVKQKFYNADGFARRVAYYKELNKLAFKVKGIDNAYNIIENVANLSSNEAIVSYLMQELGLTNINITEEQAAGIIQSILQDINTITEYGR